MRTRDEILRRIEALTAAPTERQPEPVWVRNKMIRELNWALGLCRCGHIHRATRCASCECQFGDGEPVNDSSKEQTQLPAPVIQKQPVTLDDGVPHHVDDATDERFKLVMDEID